MVAAGVVPENTAAVFGMHVWPGVEKGKVLVKAGPLMASTTTIQIRCHGLGAHCGKRELGKDALMTMAQILVRSKEAESLSNGDGSILFFGKLQSGTSHNIVASEAAMKGTLRTFCPETREKVLKVVAECGFVRYNLSSERRMMVQHSSISASEIVSGGEMRKAVLQ